MRLVAEGEPDLLHPLVVAVIVVALRRLAPQLVGEELSLERLLVQESLPASIKLDLLNAAMDHGGPRLLLQLGSALHDSAIATHPVVLLLQNTTSVEELVEKYVELTPALNTLNCRVPPPPPS